MVVCAFVRYRLEFVKTQLVDTLCKSFSKYFVLVLCDLVCQK